MNRCILVFGMPRSGSTWIGKLFDSDPILLCRYEPSGMQGLSRPLLPSDAIAAQYRGRLGRLIASSQRSCPPKPEVAI